MSEALTTSDAAPGALAGDRQTFSGALHDYWVGLRAGDLGSLPIIAGLIIIAVIFQRLNSNFLTAGNMVNLIVQMAGIATIAIGVVFVLLLGEIDLSVGYVSGIAGVITALLVLEDKHFQTSGAIAILLALGAGAAIGLVQGLIVAKVGVPSFVVTLAGLLIWQGGVLKLIGNGGTVAITNTTIIDIANKFLSDWLGWALAIAIVGGYAAVQFSRIWGRKRAGLPSESLVLPLLRIGGLALALLVVVLVANRDRGVPLVGVILGALLVFWTFVATRTRFGRHVYAVGGNAEAARRAGINVDGIRIAVFMISGIMAALGGIVLASRLFSVDTEAGGGSLLLDSIAAAVIGGTSLFGGRGQVKSALLGALVIGGVRNGMGLKGYTAGTQFVVTGLILLAAVTVDSISRKRLAAAGR